jgi:hypothetical protein
MSIIKRILVPRSIRRTPGPRTLFVLLLTAAALCGCARRYDILLVNGDRVTNVRKPTFDTQAGYWTFVAGGAKHVISAGRVVNIVPHGDTNWMFSNQ